MDERGDDHLLTVRLSPRSEEALAFLAAQAKPAMTKTDAINKALQLYADFKKLQNLGGSVCIRDAESDVWERVELY